jgi:hypothetical protein
MTYAADKQIDARWTVPVDIRNSRHEELWLACAHADKDEARRLLLAVQRHDAAASIDALHLIFFACGAAFDVDTLKAEVNDALASGRTGDDLPELLLPLLTTMRMQALETLESLMCANDPKFSARALSPLLTVLRAIRTRSSATVCTGIYRDYTRSERHVARSSLIFFRALEFGMPALAALYLRDYNFQARDYLSEKLIAAAHHGQPALVRTLLDTHFDTEPVNCVAVRAALGNGHLECAQLILADRHYVPRDDANDLVGFETQPWFVECDKLLAAARARRTTAAL